MTPPRRTAAHRALQSTLGAMMRLDRWLARVPGRREAFLLLVAALVGLVAGYGAIVLRLLMDLVARISFPRGAGLDALAATPWWAVVLPPAIGGLIVSVMVTYLAPEARGHGVPEVMDACANHGGRIRPRVAIVKVVASSISIASGGSVGREGPMAQVGAAAASAFGRALHFKGPDINDLVAAGAAGGIAAAFNAPVAGALFGSEVILGRGSAARFSRLIVSTVVATVVAHIHLGHAPGFSVPPYALVNPWELGLYVLLGGLAAAVGVLFTRGLYAIEDLWEKLPLPIATWGLLGGASVGLLGAFFPQVLGSGTDVLDAMLNGRGAVGPSYGLSPAALLLLLIPLKILATANTIGSGGSGGIFAPSLFLGAALGDAFGAGAARLLPASVVAPPGAYATVGMGAVVAATTHAPLSAILIVFELTQRPSVLLPLMLSCVLSTVIAKRLCHESIYTLKLVRRGTRIGFGAEAEIALRTPVTAIAEPPGATLRPESPLAEIVHHVIDDGRSVLYVVDDAGALAGVITMDEIRTLLRDEDALGGVLVAADVMHPPGGSLAPDETVDHAMALFARREQDELPLLDEHGRLLGRVTRADVIALYNRELLREEAPLSFVDGDGNAQEVIRLPSGEVRAEIPVEGGLAGRTLRELNLRYRFGVQVYAVRHPREGTTTPDPDAPLQKGATLVAVGPLRGIQEVRGLATS